MQQLRRRLLWHRVSQCCYTAVLGLIPIRAFAESGVTLETVLENATDYLNNTLARVVGVLMIIIAGYLCLFVHRLPKEKFFMIAVGLGLIYGGSSLFNLLTGGMH